MKSINNIKVLILVGGKGTRLQSVVQDVPKPMAPIGQFPFLQYLINYLSQFGLKDIVLLTGYMSHIIKNHFKEGSAFGVSISYSHEAVPMGTGGAIKMAMAEFPAEKYLVLNGDTFFKIDFRSFVETKFSDALLALCHTDNTSRYGKVEMALDGKIIAFLEKDLLGTPGYINAGTYLLERSIMASIPDGPCSFEEKILHKFTSLGKLKGVKYDSEFIDIGIPEDYQRALELIPEWLNQC